MAALLRRGGLWTHLSCRFATNQPPDYFRDRIVFIGFHPSTTTPGDEKDEFLTPYTRWTGKSMGGVHIMITSFLNLVNEDWLRRPEGWLEVLVLVVAGALLGGILPLARPWAAITVAAGVTPVLALSGVSLSYFTNYWFPWLVIAGGQVPCALAWALIARTFREPVTALELAGAAWRPGAVRSHVTVPPAEPLPDTPDYQLLNPPFGRGAYGKVWLARNAIGEWQAVKVIYLASFGKDADPCEREFSGIKRYKPISAKHPGLLRVDFVSNKKSAGYFYYVMELGDGLGSGLGTRTIHLQTTRLDQRAPAGPRAKAAGAPVCADWPRAGRRVGFSPQARTHAPRYQAAECHLREQPAQARRRGADCRNATA